MSTDYTPETITIQLTQGYSTIIDVDNADLAELKWHARKHHTGTFYATRGIPKDKKTKKWTTTQLARVILERKLGRLLLLNEFADHINGDTLDNREDNLRVATQTENARNSKRPKNNTSGYKGVSYKKRNQQWVAQININGQRTHLGLYPTPELAYEAYKEAAIKYYGEFARLE